VDQQLNTRGWFAGMKASAAALASVAALHLGTVGGAAQTLTWTNGAGQTYTWTQTTKVSRDRLTVPLCVRIPSTGDNWGGAQVGTLAAQGDGSYRATSYKVQFTDTRVTYDLTNPNTTVILYTTPRSDPNARHDIGAGKLTVDRRTRLVSGTIQLYGPLALAGPDGTPLVNFLDDTFRIEGGGLSPDRGILDCIG
jgi:hypothetical protein